MAISLPILLIIIGIVLALLVSWALGVVVIVIGLALLLWPYLSGGRSARV
jgi:hypothetical protein